MHLNTTACPAKKKSQFKRSAEGECDLQSRACVGLGSAENIQFWVWCQEDQEFKPSLGYYLRLSLRKRGRGGRSSRSASGGLPSCRTEAFGVQREWKPAGAGKGGVRQQEGTKESLHLQRHFRAGFISWFLSKGSPTAPPLCSSKTIPNSAFPHP